MAENELDPIDRAFAEGTPIDQALEEAVREALTFPLWHIEEITRFARLVLPILEEMGLWVSPHKRGWSW
jgi:hypothetical protein